MERSFGVEKSSQNGWNQTPSDRTGARLSLPATLGALAKDVLGALGIPGGDLANRALDAVLRKRAEQARDILLDELRHGEKTLSSDDIEEGVAILYRYARAAHEGTARLNLRLMAQVLVGQLRTERLQANEFLVYADVLTALRRDEIVLLGCFYRHWHTLASDQTERDPRAFEAQKMTRSELVPQYFANDGEVDAAFAAIVRTGLLGTTTGFDGGTYWPTRLFAKLCSDARFEAAAGQEPA